MLTGELSAPTYVCTTSMCSPGLYLASGLLLSFGDVQQSRLLQCLLSQINMEIVHVLTGYHRVLLQA